MEKQYLIKKTLNNNCMLVDDAGKEKMLIGKGIAFGKKTGALYVSNAQLEKVFVIEEKENVTDFQHVLKRNDEEFVSFCEELIWELSKKVNTVLNERIHISLIDHISGTVRRLKIGEQIVNPFLQETQVLYRKEMELAKDFCLKVERRYQVEIPEGEVGFVALHIHSAIYNGRIQNALKSNRVCNKVLTLLECEFHKKIDRKSFDCGRFMAHLTYLMKRLSSNALLKDELAEVIIEKYPDSSLISQKVAVLLEKELKVKKIPLEEVAFLTIHIERLANTLGCSSH